MLSWAAKSESSPWAASLARLAGLPSYNQLSAAELVLCRLVFASKNTGRCGDDQHGDADDFSPTVCEQVEEFGHCSQVEPCWRGAMS